MMDLRGMVTLVAGGLGHIGTAFSAALTELSARFIVLDLNQSAIQVAEQLQVDFGVDAFPLQVDLTDQQGVQTGELFTLRSARSIRSDQGLYARYLGDVLGHRDVRDIPRGTLLSWDFISREAKSEI